MTRCPYRHIIAIGVLVSVQTASARTPWAGDCDVIERLDQIVGKLGESSDITDQDFQFLIQNLDDQDEVAVALSAYALGHVRDEKDVARLELAGVLERAGGRHNLGTCFSRIALTMLDLQEADRAVTVRTYQALLDDSDPCVQVWAARTLIGMKELNGVESTLTSIAESDHDLSDYARVLLGTLSGKPPRPPLASWEFLLVEGIISRELQFPPCLGLRYLAPPRNLSSWPGDCGRLHNVQDILGLLRVGQPISSASQETLTTDLQADEPVLAAVAAHCLGFVDTENESITQALIQRMKRASAMGGVQHLVAAYCRIAMVQRSAGSVSAQESAVRLRELAFEGDDILTVTLALEQLVERGLTDGIKEEMKKRVVDQPNLSSFLAPVFYALKYPDRPRIYSGPTELEIVQRLIDNAPTIGLCASD